MEDNQRIIPATHLPRGWEWRLYDDGSGSLFSPENKRVVTVDFQTSEYHTNGDWNFMSGYPHNTISRAEFMDSAEKAVRIRLEREKGASLMKSYKVTITEKLELTVEVKAANRQEAEKIIHEQYKRSDYVLNADHFAGVHFKVEPALKQRDLER